MAKEKRVSILDGIDTALNKQFEEIVRDIEELQFQIDKADRKKAKKAKKKMKKGKVMFYDPKSKKARIRAANHITSEEVFGSIMNFLRDTKPIVVLLARLVAAIILAILSLDVVKRHISKQALGRMREMFDACVGIVGQPA